MVARVQYPSPNYSHGRPSSRLLVVHTSEGATTKESLGNFLANPSAQVSYQAGFDNHRSDEIAVYVRHYDTAWAAYDANAWGQHGCHCTPSGAAQGWTRAEWLATQDNAIRACAGWLREEADRYGLPLVKLSRDEVAAGASGICGHGDLPVKGGHTDPGPGYPWDVCLAYALGKPFPEPEPEVPDKMYVVFETNGGLFLSDGVLFRWIPDIAQVKYIVEHYGGKPLETHPDIPDTPLQFGAPANADTAAKARVPFP